MGKRTLLEASRGQVSEPFSRSRRAKTEVRKGGRKRRPKKKAVAQIRGRVGGMAAACERALRGNKEHPTRPATPSETGAADLFLLEA